MVKLFMFNINAVHAMYMFDILLAKLTHIHIVPNHVL